MLYIQKALLYNFALHKQNNNPLLTRISNITIKQMHTHIHTLVVYIRIWDMHVNKL